MTVRLDLGLPIAWLMHVFFTHFQDIQIYIDYRDLLFAPVRSA